MKAAASLSSRWSPCVTSATLCRASHRVRILSHTKVINTLCSRSSPHGARGSTRVLWPHLERALGRLGAVSAVLCSQQVHLGSVVQQEGCLLQDKGRGGDGTPRGSASEGTPACSCPRLPVWSPLALGPRPQPAVGQPISPALGQTLGSCLSVSCSREGPWLEGCLPIAVAPPSPGCQSP